MMRKGDRQFTTFSLKVEGDKPFMQWRKKVERTISKKVENFNHAFPRVKRKSVGGGRGIKETRSERLKRE